MSAVPCFVDYDCAVGLSADLDSVCEGSSCFHSDCLTAFYELADLASTTAHYYEYYPRNWENLIDAF